MIGRRYEFPDCNCNKLIDDYCTEHGKNNPRSPEYWKNRRLPDQDLADIGIFTYEYSKSLNLKRQAFNK